VRPFLLLCSCVLCGCAPALPPPGTLRVGIGAEPATLDPELAQGISEQRVLGSLYEGLVLPFPEGEQPVSAGVADRWQVDPTGLRYTFYLHQGAKWSNGAPLTASDFAWSYHRALSPRLASPNRDLLKNIKELGVPDPHTLVILLKQPDPIFLQKLTLPVFYPIYRPSLEAIGAADRRSGKIAEPLVGNGPFRMVSHRPYQCIVVEKNPFYSGSSGISLRQIRFYPIENRSSEEIAFLSGVLDITMALPLEKVAAYKSDSRLRIDPALQVEYVLINTKKPPFDRADVRRAFSMALDRKAICGDILRAGQSPAWRFVPPDCGTDYSIDDGDDPDILRDDAPLGSPTGLVENPVRARELARGIGFLPLPSYCFNSSEARKTVAEALQSQWGKSLGVEVEVRNLEWKTFLKARADGNFILARTGWSADLNDPSNFLELFMSDNPNNTTGWRNAEYDRLVKQRDFAKAEGILLKEMPCIPLYFNPNVYLISPRVRGWDPDPLDRHDWRKIRVE